MLLVLFDCDGTLVDSAGLIHEVMVRTFVHFGHAPPSFAETKSIIGLTLDIAIARLQGKRHADDEAVAMMAHYKQIFAGVRAGGLATERPYDGIPEVIAALAAREDVLIGAVTGKARRGLNLVLESNGWSDHFQVGRTADDCPSKPHPAMVTECCAQMGTDARDTVVIGDAIYDMQMAKSAGAHAIGVSWGYASVAELEAAGADVIAQTPADLLGLILRERADA
ncbi:HAD-IA family hydrolase [Rhizobium halophytocola]|uniref:Phosphoglycolate phosphatase n=1 Tax=Rhizobium halophytocola TaxID=735519 RepID=A0ABS4DZH8_9HYPH|nr:HAD-IA family hydrolase [Rhizobium halophytocola]MBP1851094.1 phosphoglycolate phosphatase [Rhizobium halophytocola]